MNHSYAYTRNQNHPMSKKTKSQKSEDFDPTDLEAISASGDPASQFIVKIDFDYCGVSYVGYQILSRNEIGMLLVGLRSGAQVGTLNMPGDWYEDFDISELDGAFSIHSADPGDVAAMLSLFGHWVGQASYFDSVLEAARAGPLTIEIAKQFLKNAESIDLSEMTSITDEAAEALSKHEGDLDLGGLSEACCLALLASPLSIRWLRHSMPLVGLDGLGSLLIGSALDGLGSLPLGTAPNGACPTRHGR